MTENNPISEEEEMLGTEIEEGDQALDLIQNAMDTFLSAANVDAVYAQPIKDGETLIIPAAEIVAGMGFGVGSGYGGNKEEDESNEGGGSGGGGGGKVLSRPVAVIISSPTGVRVEPVVDVTKISLAMFTSICFMLGMLLKMRNPKKCCKE